MAAPSEDVVTICIPAYQAQGFLAETVESALAQTHPAVRLVIVVDPGRDETPRIARRYAGSRVQVMVNQQRRGWIGNTNFALAQARSRYAMILPHDDVLGPAYVATCLEGLKANPGAANCYSKIDIIGDPANVIGQQSLTGDLGERVATLLAALFDSVAYRGIIDRKVVTSQYLPTSTANYAADTLWIGKLACQGALIEVPEVHYHKRLLPTSAHVSWAPRDAAEFYEMWAVHCLELVSVILDTRPDLEWTPRLQQMFELRVRKHRTMVNRFPPNPLMEDPSIDIGSYVSEVADQVHSRPRPYSWVRG